MTHQTAPLFRRLAALLYDTIVALGVILLATLIAVILNKGQAITSGNYWMAAYLLLSIFAYFVLSWKWRGQTIGMRAWRLHIQTDTGEPVQWTHCFLRFASAIPALLIFGIGWMFSWHDKLSGTALTYSQQ